MKPHGLILMLGAVIGPSGLSIEGSTRCPTVEAVATHLAPLVAPLHPSGAPQAVRLSDSGDGVTVELWAGPRRLADRVLARRSDCDQMADLVAVLVAAWQLDLEADLGVAPALRSPEPPTHGSNIDVTLAAMSWPGLSSSPLGFGLGLAAALRPASWPLGFRVSVWGSLPRTYELSGAQARVQRFGFDVGATRRWDFHRLFVALFAGGEGTWLFASGRGLPDNASAVGFEPAANAGAQLGLRNDHAGAFVGVGGIGWLNQQTLTITPAASTAEETRVLPRFELTLSVGLACFWP